MNLIFSTKYVLNNEQIDRFRLDTGITLTSGTIPSLNQHPLLWTERVIGEQYIRDLLRDHNVLDVGSNGRRNQRHENIHSCNPCAGSADIRRVRTQGLARVCNHTLRNCTCRPFTAYMFIHSLYYVDIKELAEAVQGDKIAYAIVHQFTKGQTDLYGEAQANLQADGMVCMHVRGSNQKYRHRSLFWLQEKDYYTNGTIAMGWYLKQTFGNAAIYEFYEAPVQVEFIPTQNEPLAQMSNKDYVGVIPAGTPFRGIQLKDEFVVAFNKKPDTTFYVQKEKLEFALCHAFSMKRSVVTQDAIKQMLQKRFKNGHAELIGTVMMTLVYCLELEATAVRAAISESEALIESYNLATMWDFSEHSTRRIRPLRTLRRWCRISLIEATLFPFKCVKKGFLRIREKFRNKIKLDQNLGVFYKGFRNDKFQRDPREMWADKRLTAIISGPEYDEPFSDTHDRFDEFERRRRARRRAPSPSVQDVVDHATRDGSESSGSSTSRSVTGEQSPPSVSTTQQVSREDLERSEEELTSIRLSDRTYDTVEGHELSVIEPRPVDTRSEVDIPDSKQLYEMQTRTNVVRREYDQMVTYTAQPSQGFKDEECRQLYDGLVHASSHITQGEGWLQLSKVDPHAPLKESRVDSEVSIINAEQQDGSWKGPQQVGQVFSASIPVVSADTVSTQLCAVMNRCVQQVPPLVVDTNQLRNFAGTLLPNRRANGNVFTKKTFPEWNKRFDTNRQRQNREAQNEYDTQGLKQRDPCLVRRSFIKSELLVGKSLLGCFDPYDHRLIQGVGHKANVILGPVVLGLQDAFKGKWEHSNRNTRKIFYTSGATAEDLGHFYAKARRKFEYIYSSDFSRYDSTIGPELLDLELWVYEQCGITEDSPDPQLRDAWRVLSAQKTTLGYTRNVKYSVKATRKSGDPNTSLGNSIISAIITAHVLSRAGVKKFYIMVQGDDVLIFCGKLVNQEKIRQMFREYGLQSDFNQRDHFNASFCSGYFYPVDGNNPDDPEDNTCKYVYGPKMSRFLTKAGWSLRQRHDRFGYFKTKMVCELHNVHFIPLLRDYVNVQLEKLEGVNQVDSLDKEDRFKRYKVVENHQATQCTWRDIFLRYSIGEEEIKQFVDTIRDGPANLVSDDPIMSKLIAQDAL